MEFSLEIAPFPGKRVRNLKKIMTSAKLAFSTIIALLLFPKCSSPPREILIPAPPIYEWKVLNSFPGKDSPLPADSAYSDSLIKVHFATRPNVIQMTIVNISHTILTLNWASSYFTLPQKNKDPAIHSEIRYEDRLKPPNNRILPPLHERTFYLAPESRVEWNAKSKQWRSYPMLQGSIKNLKEKRFVFHFAFTKGSQQYERKFEFIIEKAQKVESIKPERVRTIQTVSEQKPDSIKQIDTTDTPPEMDIDF